MYADPSYNTQAVALDVSRPHYLLPSAFSLNSEIALVLTGVPVVGWRCRHFGKYKSSGRLISGETKTPGSSDCFTAEKSLVQKIPNPFAGAGFTNSRFDTLNIARSSLRVKPPIYNLETLQNMLAPSPLELITQLLLFRCQR